MWRETFIARMSVVKGGVKFGAEEVSVKEKPAGWKLTRFCLHCFEEHAVLCVDCKWGGVEFVVLRWE